jgi:hypothetical protein
MSAEASPRPWRVEGNTIWDAEGGVVVSALNPCDRATRRLIVDAVNECDRLREIVRTFADVTHSLIANYEHRYRDDPNSMEYVANVRKLIREARAAIGEATP